MSPRKHVSRSWVAYSSYDLTDRRDGASQHLAEIFAVLGPALSAPLTATKRTGGGPRTSLGHVLRAVLRRMTRWPWQWRDPRRGLLLGMHCLLLAPFFAPGIYIPLDCWSAREAGLAARGHGLRGYLRRTYAAAILMCEALLLPRVLRVLVVSQAEKDAYLARHPALAERIMVLPWRAPKISTPVAPAPPSADCSVLIWMDARTSYGRQSIQTCLAGLEAWPELRVTILSRSEDLGLPLGSNRSNMAFADDLHGLLCQQALVILPDAFGTGIKNRALEVAIHGIPMLATPYAIEGLGWQPPEDFIWLYSNDTEFDAALHSLLRSPSRARVVRLRDRVAAEIAGSRSHLLNLIADL